MAKAKKVDVKVLREQTKAKVEAKEVIKPESRRVFASILTEVK